MSLPVSSSLRSRGRPACVLLACALLFSLVSGCASYSERTAAARAAARIGNYEGALGQLEGFLGVPQGKLPKKWNSNTALGVLERASVLQALERFEASALDYQAADKELEMLDLAGDASGSIARYLFSESSAKYQTSPTEKLSLNALNMLNYLSLGDLQSARVEAQRFTVIRNYLRDFDPAHAYGTIGSYLAGFVFEKLGDLDRAMRYYDEALEHGSLDSLRAPLARLAPRTSYRGPNLKRFLAEEGAAGRASDADATEVLVVVNLGTAPLKVPERMAIGAAVGLYSVYITGDTKILERSALKMISYPALSESPNKVFKRASVALDGKTVPVERISDLAGDIRREYEETKGKLIGAAVSRMLVRAAAAEAARAAAREMTKDSKGGGGALAGLLAGLLVEGTLVAADTPDTRSWTFLPGEVYAARVAVAPGTHEIRVVLSGSGETETRTLDVEVPAGRFAAVVVTALR